MKAVALIGVIALYAGREDDLEVYPGDFELQRGDAEGACSLALA